MDFPLVVMGITIIILVCMSGYILALRNKKVLHYIFLTVVIEVLVWSVAVVFRGLSGNDLSSVIVWENITYIGISMAPVSIIMLGKAYSKPDKPLSWKFLLLFIVPVITQVMAWTTDVHGWFYQEYGVGNEPNTPGLYFFIHAAYSYICLLIGFIALSYFAIRNSGVATSQAFLIVIGSVVPTVVNIFFTFNLFGFNVYSTPIAFTFTLAMYLLAMFRFNLLKVAPIALQTVINRISDCFVVVDNNLNIIDYNKPFADNFNYISGLHKGDNFNRIVDNWNCRNLAPDSFRDLIKDAGESNMTLVKDIEIDIHDSQQYFTVEFTPIIQRGACVAVILLFKNITQHVKDVEKIKENQAILLERERLASLGQLIGGIAHNLKTPIMSVAGGIEQLHFLADEYAASIDDSQVTREDHLEIADEMQQWLSKMKTHLGYMSDIISTVKDQATQFNIRDESWFTLDEMLKRVGILMQHEFVKHNCIYKQDIHVDLKQKIDGDINSLVQILDNIIVNAIQSYGGSGGEIVLRAERKGRSLLLSVTDFGKGIDEKIKDRLFKEMITTKGKHGTGLGLYMSYSTIKGVFRGHMWFESAAKSGTSFYIQLPLPEEQTLGGEQYA